MDESEVVSGDASKKSYSWINRDVNKIDFNGAKWKGLYDKATQPSEGPLRILLLGDSHIQADMSTAVVRREMQKKYGNAGRGLIAPLKMAGTNQPVDYKLSSSTSGWTTARLLKKPWLSPMKFTGATATTEEEFFDLKIETLSRPKVSPFTSVRVFYDGEAPLPIEMITLDGDTNKGLNFHGGRDGDNMITIELGSIRTGCTLGFYCPGKTTIAGVELLNEYIDEKRGGVVFSAIGSNGAAYQSYLGIGTGKDMALTAPDLIILSLGTNDAWGAMTDEAFVKSVDDLISEIKKNNPGVPILIVTAQEAQKNNTPNTKVGHFAKLLCDYADENKIAVYDFYNVAGGDGSSRRWVGSGLFRPDRIHLTKEGYELMGQLFSTALIEAIESTKK